MTKNETTLCWYCGKEIPYQEDLRAYCRDCKDKKDKDYSDLYERYLKEQSLVMYEKALRQMEHQKFSMHYYYEACNVIKEKIKQDYRSFDSSHEIMVAIELINNKIKTIPHKKIERYTVDFMLPDLKIVLEIDGAWHYTSQNMLKDAKRDIEIISSLGVGWEVIRVKTSQVETKLMELVDFIKKTYKERQLLRKKHHGILPDNYSDHTKILYKDILELYKYDKDYMTDIEQKEINEKNESRLFNKYNKYPKRYKTQYYNIKNYFEAKKRGDQN